MEKRFWHHWRQELPILDTVISIREGMSRNQSIYMDGNQIAWPRDVLVAMPYHTAQTTLQVQKSEYSHVLTWYETMASTENMKSWNKVMQIHLVEPEQGKASEVATERSHEIIPCFCLPMWPSKPSCLTQHNLSKNQFQDKLELMLMSGIIKEIKLQTCY